MNQFKAPNIEPKAKSGKFSVADETIKKASDFSFFVKKEHLKGLLWPMSVFVFLTIIYVFLSHYHVKSLRKQDELKKEINELRSEYISIKSSLMKKSNQSEVSKRLESEEIKELITPPYVIQPLKK